MSLISEFRKARRYVSEQGIRSCFGAARDYVRYHLKDKWRFVYLGFSFDHPMQLLEDPSLAVKRTGCEDLGQIRRDLFPHLVGEQAYHRAFFDRIGEDGSLCFVAEFEGRFVHYSWVFTDVFRSPLIKVPFEVSELRSSDSYIGPIFTVPGSRGMIYLYVLPTIVDYLRKVGSKRVLVLVSDRNTAAMSFYQKLGFVPIMNAERKGVVSFVCRRLNSMAG